MLANHKLCHLAFSQVTPPLFPDHWCHKRCDDRGGRHVRSEQTFGTSCSLWDLKNLSWSENVRQFLEVLTTVFSDHWCSDNKQSMSQLQCSVGWVAQAAWAPDSSGLQLQSYLQGCQNCTTPSWKQIIVWLCWGKTSPLHTLELVSTHLTYNYIYFISPNTGI